MWLYWISAALLSLLIPKLLNFYRRLRALPPGPRGVPVLGNALQVPGQMPWFKFAEWAQEFGPIFSLNLAGQPVIVLNTFKAASDLLDRRSTIYSDRPRYVMVGEILTGGIAIVFTRYGSIFRRLRRAAHDGFSIRAVERYNPILSKAAALATLQMVKSPDSWQSHIKGASASVILSAIYAWPPLTEKDEPLVNRIHAMGVRIAEAMVPWAYLVDIIPVLKHLPSWMAKWKKDGLEWHQQITEMLKGFNRDVEDKLHAGQAPKCFVADLVNNKDRHELSDNEAAWLSGLFFIAGAETTAQTLLYFVQAMLLYPEVMRKAQAELDNVVGQERLPTFEDQKSLPYIEAIVKEVLRWRTPAPMNVPRSVTEDDWYEGYLIPKGATIITNAWAMHRDRTIFPDYEDFRPDRFLDGTPDDTHSMGHASFGFGKRICVGLNFANKTLFITIATILWALNIEMAKDSDGNPIVPARNDFIEAGTSLGPAPFECNFSLRFPSALRVLQKEFPEKKGLDL